MNFYTWLFVALQKNLFKSRQPIARASSSIALISAIEVWYLSGFAIIYWNLTDTPIVDFHELRILSVLVGFVFVGSNTLLLYPRRKAIELAYMSTDSDRFLIQSIIFAGMPFLLFWLSTWIKTPL